jgi:hypothetical protein
MSGKVFCLVDCLKYRTECPANYLADVQNASENFEQNVYKNFQLSHMTTTPTWLLLAGSISSSRSTLALPTQVEQSCGTGSLHTSEILKLFFQALNRLPGVFLYEKSMLSSRW